MKQQPGCLGYDADLYVDELYAELEVPLLADKPFARSLRLSLAARYSDYSTFGDTVNSKLGEIGASMNRIDFAQQNTEILLQNTQAAESVIRDADMAYEMMQFSKQNILAQAGTAMLAQANSLSQSVLQLLR